jgi:hypothetical protein
MTRRKKKDGAKEVKHPILVVRAVSVLGERGRETENARIILLLLRADWAL